MPTIAAPAPRAMPCAAAIPIRRPVNEPGPVATATLSTDASVMRVRVSSRSMVGKSSSACRRWACHVSSARTSWPSYKATEAHSVEVSSAKRVTETLQELGRPRPGGMQRDGTLRVRDVREMHVETIERQPLARAVGPLDDRHPARVERLLPARRAEILSFEAIEIEMEERQPSAEMLVQDHERRARHLRCAQSEAGRDALREDGLPRPELAPQRDDVARSGETRESLADAFGVKGRVAHELHGLPRAKRDARSPLRARICGAQG